MHPHRNQNFKMVRLCLLDVHSVKLQSCANLLVKKINSYQGEKAPLALHRAQTYSFHFKNSSLNKHDRVAILAG